MIYLRALVLVLAFFSLALFYGGGGAVTTAGGGGGSLFTQPSLVPMGPPGNTTTGGAGSIANGVSYTVPAGAADVTASGATCTSSQPSAATMASNASAISSALNSANIWVPAGCKIWLNSGTTSSPLITIHHTNTGMYCAGDGVAGFYNVTGYVYLSTYQLFTTAVAGSASGTKIQGCVWFNTYTISQYTTQSNQLYTDSSSHGTGFFLQGGNNIVAFFGQVGSYATGIDIENNLFVGNTADQGMLWQYVTSSKFDYNVIYNNFMNNELQVVGCNNIEIAHNWMQQGSISFIDFSKDGTNIPPVSSANVFSNTFTCTVTPTGLVAGAIPSACPAGFTGLYTCMGVGYGCDPNNVSGVNNGQCNLSGVNIHDNTWAGNYAAPYYAPTGTCGDGSHDCFYPGANNQYILGASGLCTSFFY